MHLPFIIPLNRQQPLARLLHRLPVVSLSLRADGSIDLTFDDGRLMTVDPAADSTVFSLLVVLRLHIAGRVGTKCVRRNVA